MAPRAGRVLDKLGASGWHPAMPAHRHAAHTIHGDHSHIGWDNALPPVLTVAPGTTIAFECQDASGGQLTAASTLADLANLDFGRINPVTGPVHIDGAEPGDAVKITLEAFTPSGFGWTANIPGFGLLADQFPDPALHLWSYDKVGLAPAAFSSIARVPLKPFAGTIGLALAEPGVHSVVPPRRVGGNLDIRDLAAGVTLYLPVEVAGGLFSIGDTHAAQGDGEICGTAIESPMSATVTLDLVKGANLAAPRFTTPGPVTRHLDAAGYEVTTGVGPDLIVGAREAVARMVDLLCATHGMAPVDAYMLCSVCGDLRISEIVDLPNWIVSFYFPRVVFA
jgi:acetamidase/formamidase